MVPTSQAGDSLRSLAIRQAQAWCEEIAGPTAVLATHGKMHGRTILRRLRLRTGAKGYLKVHLERAPWASEVAAYQRWAPAFGPRAPRLLAVHEQEPLALLVSELAGTVMVEAGVTAAERERVWSHAGQALAELHGWAQGPCFGANAAGDAHETPVCTDPIVFVENALRQEIAAGVRLGLLSADEQAIARSFLPLVSAFAGERPVPCHRDYGPDNWMVAADGEWSGVIDFEFARWDVRVADFARYPNWEWIEHPALVDALLQGYGRALTSIEEQQCLVARAQYALSAVAWGHEHAFYGFEREGRRALDHLGDLL